MSKEEKKEPIVLTAREPTSLEILENEVSELKKKVQNLEFEINKVKLFVAGLATEKRN